MERKSIVIASVLLALSCSSKSKDGGAQDNRPSDLLMPDGGEGVVTDASFEVVPPKECDSDEDCTFEFMVTHGRLKLRSCESDADCTDPFASKCYEDYHICGCRDDLDCPTDQQCNPETRQCGYTCFTSGECGMGKKCQNGFCVEQFACNCEHKCISAQCLSDDNCGSDKYCDPCYKVCLQKLPACARCTADNQCEGLMTRCVKEVTVAGVTTVFPEAICAPWCPLATSVCAVEGAPQGAYICASIGDPKDGVCVPESLDCGKVGKKCEKDEDCEDPIKQKCWPDRHVCGCRDALSCPFGEACHPLTHQCIPGCTTDVECGVGKVCAAGLCRDACKKEGDVVIGCDDPPPMEGKEWDCDEKGHCYIPGMCFSPLDCREKETYCDTETHECKPGCLIDFDCKSSAKICDPISKKCLDKPCSGNFECACGEVCDLKADPPTCKPAQGKYCEPCDPQKGEEACGDKDTLCVEFQTEDGQSKGAYCMPPCSEDPENPCPQGWQCQEIKDTQGNSYGKKCIRFCYHKIEGCAIGNPPEPEVSPETSTLPDP